MDENVTVRIEADTQPFVAALGELEQLSQGFGRQLTGALQGAVVSGRSLEDVLRRLALNLAGMALGQGLKPLEGLFSSMFGRMLGGVVPFAQGGVVSQPTYFPMGGQMGLMGEAGAEAILPLRRGADGRLGVASGGGGQKVNVVFNVSTPDAASFRKSEAQVTGMLARAVSRGTRSL
ncbi:MAG: phage tail tape measure protein [Aliihoeflea sp.]